MRLIVLEIAAGKSLKLSEDYNVDLLPAVPIQKEMRSLFPILQRNLSEISNPTMGMFHLFSFPRGAFEREIVGKPPENKSKKVHWLTIKKLCDGTIPVLLEGDISKFEDVKTQFAGWKGEITELEIYEDISYKMDLWYELARRGLGFIWRCEKAHPSQEELNLLLNSILEEERKIAFCSNGKFQVHIYNDSKEIELNISQKNESMYIRFTKRCSDEEIINTCKKFCNKEHCDALFKVGFFKIGELYQNLWQESFLFSWGIGKLLDNNGWDAYVTSRANLKKRGVNEPLLETELDALGIKGNKLLLVECKRHKFNEDDNKTKHEIMEFLGKCSIIEKCCSKFELKLLFVTNGKVDIALQHVPNLYIISSGNFDELIETISIID